MAPDTHGVGMSAAPAGGGEDPIALLERLVALGQFEPALEAALALAKGPASGELLRRLADWRHRAYAQLPEPKPRPDWPPVYADPFPGLHGVPEIPAASLSAELLGGALHHHGSLLVRGLMEPDAAERFRQAIDTAFDARDRHYAGAAQAETLPWYAQIEAGEITRSRKWIEDGGAVLTADSPRNLADLIDLFTSSEVLRAITAYLGERPALSVGKSTLRRVPITTGTDWHQDGAFLGEQTRSVNVWLALSRCGEDAAGLDVVGRRLPYIVQPGSHGAQFDWSVGPGMVALLEGGGAPVTSPVFEAGDALLFDHLMLHRTGIRPHMTKTRWAIESWFFAPSFYPVRQAPLLL